MEQHGIYLSADDHSQFRWLAADRVLRLLVPVMIDMHGPTAYNNLYSVLVAGEPATHTTQHRSVDRDIFSRPGWADFQIVFGELVHNGNEHLFGAEPNWRPLGRPAAVAWRFEENFPQTSVARIFWGDEGQDAEEFQRQVMTELPVPRTIDERFALRGNAPVTVLVAVEPGVERDGLVKKLSHEFTDVRTADTIVETLEHLDGVDVIILADQLPPRESAQPKTTASLIHNYLPLNTPIIGGYDSQRSGRKLRSPFDPDRELLHHVLDALRLGETKLVTVPTRVHMGD